MKYSMAATFCGNKSRAYLAVFVAMAILFGSFWASAATPEGECTVYVKCDGKRYAVTLEDPTVETALAQANIVLSGDDTVVPALGEELGDGDTVEVTRRRYVIREEREEIPFETVEIPTCLLKEGVKRARVQGRPGERVTTYQRLYINGEPDGEETIVGDVKETAPVHAEILVGKPGAAISPLTLDTPLDENGVPVRYRNVMQGRRAAGYSARPGASTASGRPAIVGHVAVNPNVIPYGTKMYIRSRDGVFVYGYAIAADTGTALAQGIIDLDLFYASYGESALNGIKTVDIYILG